MKLMVMFTSCYPFETDEYFINNEITTLSDFYDDVFIFSSSKEKEIDDTINIPENVTAFSLGTEKKASALLRKTKALTKLFVKEDKLLVRQNFNARIQRAFYSASAEILYKCSINIIKKQLSKMHYNEIVLYSYWFNDLALTAVLCAAQLKEYNIKVITRAHRHDLYVEKSPTNYLPYREFLTKNIDAIFACSKMGAQYLKDRLPAYSDKIHFSYLGTKDHGQGPVNTETTFKIVSCSFCVPVKRIQIIIEALKILQDKNIDVHWTHFGGGILYNDLVSLAEDCLKEKSFYFTNMITNENLMLEYSNKPFDLFVNVSESEGLPVSIMEAASFGIPVIATNVGGTSEIISDNINGKLLNESLNAQELAQTIESFIKLDSEQKNLMRQNSRKLWVTNFNAINNYKHFINEISKLK